MIQIYLDEIRDLLNPSSGKLTLKQDPVIFFFLFCKFYKKE